ncbi:MAG: hypothetical protein A3A13_02655 [Candidatus Yanofskybacteria bacterium RIFCSPLOWO2_01_FULL_43_22]|uniref:3D domain-containing protein n=1 Tax=Candidatus Yanofskybacteria bacterium RIFCSPLOWO2_01_FULL_43_22 TaxID=1802695 RepID=A0A1F8GHP8_9BACT|nr:MAG: hypothetical protein A3D48_03600 [Candidatus Yanofskybacteria bacterium RIFCSPHIGHO2_02_FULL_43_17]OGN23959.1 MAG: hypothetical protein A3A13_02655 [Candidatus Yanofskybacteria bacterium RIFCSPLOWO2_01_FULL_43_22]
MNKKLRYTVVLFILISAFSSGIDAKAGLFDWINGGNTEWTFENIYENIASQTDKSNPAIQEVVVLESKNPITPARTKTDSVKEYVVTATAYSSTVDQTDDTPFITASGTYVRDGIAAANFLPFGTVFKIPDLYGDKIFIVEDRMNKRYWHRVDIWFPERQMAREFGVKQIRIEIVS